MERQRLWPEACLARDERLRKSWEDKEALQKKYDALYREPYQV